jgi:hypothetical protein
LLYSVRSLQQVGQHRNRPEGNGEQICKRLAHRGVGDSPQQSIVPMAAIADESGFDQAGRLSVYGLDADADQRCYLGQAIFHIGMQI